MAVEFVDVKTLRDSLNSGSIPIRKIIIIALQIADGRLSPFTLDNLANYF
jgi:hypothetical protein